MNPMLLSPHQFNDLKEFMDTLIVTVYDVSPLDIALPVTASEMIGMELASRVQDRFQGRCAYRLGGQSTVLGLQRTDHLDILCDNVPYTVQYVLVLMDRTLVDEWVNHSTEGRKWIFFDWWQWIRKRVPDTRQLDAFMYLSVACPTYFQSEACQTIGFDEGVLDSMRREGNRLFHAMEEEIALRLKETWVVPGPTQDGK